MAARKTSSSRKSTARKTSASKASTSRKKTTGKSGTTRKTSTAKKGSSTRKKTTATQRKAATTKKKSTRKKAPAKKQTGILGKLPGGLGGISLPSIGGGKKKAAPPPKKKSPSKKSAPPPQFEEIPLPAFNDWAASPSPSTGLSLDRKLDIVGVLLALVGLLTLISLVTPNTSSLVGFWVNTMRKGFGVGAFFLSFTLIGVGTWLIIRNFDRIPSLEAERAIGIVMLFANLLIWLHWFWGTGNGEIPRIDVAYPNAALGMGGGYLGAFGFVVLYGGLGPGGLSVVILAWLVLGLAMTLDMGVIELFQWVPRTIVRYQDLQDDYRVKRAEREDITSIAPGVASAPMTRANPIEPNAALATAKGGQVSTEMPDIQIGVTPGSSERREWLLPKTKDMLNEGDEAKVNDQFDRERATLIEETLGMFGAPVNVVEINRGPTITQFGVEPSFIENRSGTRTRVRVNKISSLSDDLALALAASRIRIQAPVPGKGFVGIEVPNEEISLVALRDVLESQAFRKLESNLRFALGQDVAGNAVAVDLGAMPHLLVAGATGSGKSVCVNAIIAGMLIHNTPDQLRMIMVDPKRVELTGYNGVPHLLAPVVTEIDRVVGVLQWVEREMDGRYQKFADLGARNIKDYNLRATRQKMQPLPYLVLIIDELADMMMVAPDQTERHITRLAQLARATGIHLIISTQRPSVDVVTGLIKANFPARIAFAVASGIDSRVILDQPGAERLLGRGDMLFQAPDAPAPVRMQGVFVSDEELLNIVEYWRRFAGTTTTAHVATSTPADAPPSNIPLKQMGIWDEMEEKEAGDPVYAKAVDIIKTTQRASISMLQRQLRIGYTRAARLVDQMEEEGLIGPPTGTSAPREVLVPREDDGEGELGAVLD